MNQQSEINLELQRLKAERQVKLAKKRLEEIKSQHLATYRKWDQQCEAGRRLIQWVRESTWDHVEEVYNLLVHHGLFDGYGNPDETQAAALRDALCRKFDSLDPLLSAIHPDVYLEFLRSLYQLCHSVVEDLAEEIPYRSPYHD